MKAGWIEVALGEVAALVRDVVEPSAIADGTLYVGLENIERGGAFTNVARVSNGELASAKFAFDSSHILYGKLRPNLGKVARPEFAGVCSTDILPIAPGPRIDRNYLTHFLVRPATVALAASRAAGANLPRLAPAELMRFRLPLPPLAEQRRIARVLDSVEAIRAKTRRALDAVEELLSSLFLHTFGDPLEQSGRWPMTTLSEAVREGTIVTYGIVQAGEEVPDGVPYIRTGDIVSGEIAQDQLRHTAPPIAARFSRSRVHAGDIVISIRATVGTTAVVPPELDGANLTQGTARIAPTDAVHGTYLLNLLRSASVQRWIQQQVKGATFREITLARLRELPVTLPPRGLQEAFARNCAEIGALRVRQCASLAYLGALMASTQHRAFDGQL